MAAPVPPDYNHPGPPKIPQSHRELSGDNPPYAPAPAPRRPRELSPTVNLPPVPPARAHCRLKHATTVGDGVLKYAGSPMGRKAPAHASCLQP